MAKKTLRPTKKEAKDFLKSIEKALDKSKPVVLAAVLKRPDGQASWAWLGLPENIVVACEFLKGKALRRMEEMGEQMKANEDDERR